MLSGWKSRVHAVLVRPDRHIETKRLYLFLVDCFYIRRNLHLFSLLGLIFGLLISNCLLSCINCFILSLYVAVFYVYVYLFISIHVGLSTSSHEFIYDLCINLSVYLYPSYLSIFLSISMYLYCFYLSIV